MLISEEWRKANAQLHEERADFGSKLVPERIDRLKAWAKKLGTIDILDYGCGKGISADAINARGYDPAVPRYSADPVPAHLLVCWDVLEHVEPPCLPSVLDHIRSLGRHVYIIVGTRKDSTKLMPDGRNPHLIIEPAEWWLTLLREKWPLSYGKFSTKELEFFGE